MSTRSVPRSVRSSDMPDIDREQYRSPAKGDGRNFRNLLPESCGSCVRPLSESCGSCVRPFSGAVAEVAPWR